MSTQIITGIGKGVIEKLCNRYRRFYLHKISHCPTAAKELLMVNRILTTRGPCRSYVHCRYLQSFLQIKEGDCVVVPIDNKQFAIGIVKKASRPISALQNDHLKDMSCDDGDVTVRDGEIYLGDERQDLGYFIELEDTLFEGFKDAVFTWNEESELYKALKDGMRILDYTVADPMLRLLMKTRCTTVEIGEERYKVGEAYLHTSQDENQTKDKAILAEINKYIVLSHRRSLSSFLQTCVEKERPNDVRILYHGDPDRIGNADLDLCFWCESHQKIVYMQFLLKHDHLRNITVWAEHQISEYRKWLEDTKENADKDISYELYIVTDLDNFAKGINKGQQPEIHLIDRSYLEERYS